MFTAKRLFGYLVTGEMPEMTALDESLAEHDKKYHPDGYNEGDSCNKRDMMSKEDKSDSTVLSRRYVDADGNEISPWINENDRHSHEKPSWIVRPRYEELEPIEETELNRSMPSIGIQNGITTFRGVIVPIDGHHVKVPGSSSLWVHKNKGEPNVIRIERDERMKKILGCYQDGMSTSVYNDSLKAIKKLSDDGMFMQSFRCDYSEEANGFGRLVFTKKEKISS